MIHFYESEAKSTHIIAYGDTPVKDRHFKITFESGEYCAYKKKSGKYWLLSTASNLEHAKKICIINYAPIR